MKRILFASSIVVLVMILSACTTEDDDSNTTTTPKNPQTNPAIEFSQADYIIGETDATVAITVNRLGESTEAVSVDYATQNGSAISGSDFIAKSGSLSWAAGDSTSKTVYIQIKADIVNSEGDERFTINLSNPSPNIELGLQPTSTVTIKDLPCNGTLPAIVNQDLTVQDCTFVNSSVSVRNNAVLTIAAGTTLIFNSGIQLYIESDGALTAVGSLPKPIVFTGAQASSGYWWGIDFQNSNSAANELAYVTIEYGGPAGSSSSPDGAVEIFGATGRIKIHDSLITDSNGFGIVIGNGTVIDQFSRLTLTRNAAGPLNIAPNLVYLLDPNSDYSGNTVDEVFIEQNGLTGPVVVDQTWPRLNVPYSIGFVQVDAKLQLSAGSEYRFRLQGRLQVNQTGTVSAQGTSADPIRLTAQQLNPGYWDGVYLINADSNNQLNNVIIEYADQYGIWASGTVQLSLVNTIIRNSAGYGVRLSNQTALNGFANNTITGNANAPLFMFPEQVRFLDINSEFTGNGVDAIYLDRQYSSVVSAQTWQALQVPYSFELITVDNHLTIAPGAELIARNGGAINVSSTGMLTAVGDLAKPILFSAEQKTAGYWEGIRFSSSNHLENLFDYVTVEYGGGNNLANIYLSGGPLAPSNLSVSNSYITNSSSYGIRVSADSSLGAQNNFYEFNALGNTCQEPSC